MKSLVTALSLSLLLFSACSTESTSVDHQEDELLEQIANQTEGLEAENLSLFEQIPNNSGTLLAVTWGQHSLPIESGMEDTFDTVQSISIFELVDGDALITDRTVSARNLFYESIQNVEWAEDDLTVLYEYVVIQEDTGETVITEKEL